MSVVSQMCMATPGVYLHRSGKYKSLYVVKPTNMVLVVRKDRSHPFGKVTFEVALKRGLAFNLKATRISFGDAHSLLLAWSKPIASALNILQADEPITILKSKA